MTVSKAILFKTISQYLIVFLAIVYAADILLSSPSKSFYLIIWKIFIVVLPLLLFYPGITRGNRQSAIFLVLVLLIYFMSCVVKVITLANYSWGLLELILSVTLITSLMLFMKNQQ